jgi:hypothetical protein
MGLVAVATAILELGALIGSAKAASSTFQATALVTNAHNHTEIQCWQLITSFNATSLGGSAESLVYDFGRPVDFNYAVVPGPFPGAPHPAPAVQ